MQMNFALEHKRIVVTQADEFMGPAICTMLERQGAIVHKHFGSLVDVQASEQLISESGDVDILIANLALPAPTTRAHEVSEEEWQEVFNVLVHPLPRLVRAVLPQMIARKSGKIIVVGSASALRGINRASTYSAARGAQLSYVQAIGVELAPHNIQVNAIAQNFVDNPTYFPPEVQTNPRFQERLKREVPLGRLVAAEEDAAMVAYLCSDAANCFVGQVFPVAGGWVI